jgi:tripeptide aminopeptidase
VAQVPAPSACRATADERTGLQEHFRALCAVRSPSGDERACADRVTGVLRGLGLTVVEDGVGAALDGNAGNLLCRIPAAPTAAAAVAEATAPGDASATPGPQDEGSDGQLLLSSAPVVSPAEPAPTVLLCAHLDTVAVGAEIRPEVRDGAWVDGLGGVLGADNKASVAVLLAAAERLARQPIPVEVELLFTVQEEPQLRGIDACDLRELRARCGYVIDHPSPLGGIVMSAPGHVRFDARYRGRAAHAAISPEDGRSAVLAAVRAVAALPAGRLANGATVNVGHISGGDTASHEPATNVVPMHARIVGEVRAPSSDELQATVDAIEAALHDAAHDPRGPVDLDLRMETRFVPYGHTRRSKPVDHATAAMEALGIVPRPFVDAGGSDANVLNARGIPTVNLAGGNRGAHEPGESMPVEALDQTLDLVLTILESHRPDLSGA